MNKSYNSSNLEILVHDVLILLIDKYQMINDSEQATRNKRSASRNHTPRHCVLTQLYVNIFFIFIFMPETK